METCQSPLKVFITAYRLGKSVLPEHSSKFSRHDFTLPQLFACLVLREFFHLSFRRTQALLQDSAHWLSSIGLAKAPDHNTLWRAFEEIVRVRQMDSMLDVLAEIFASHQPEAMQGDLAADASCYELRHVSRYFERRCQESRRRKNPEKTAKQRRSEAVKNLPKMGIAIASGCHLIVAATTLTGGGPDLPLLPGLLKDALRRGGFRRLLADAGFDAESVHRLACERHGIPALIPPTAGRPTSKPAAGRHRRRMQALFGSKEALTIYGQRWQVETVHSMIKRNQGSALRAITRERRERELFLKIITHNVMLARRSVRVETERVAASFCVLPPPSPFLVQHSPPPAASVVANPSPRTPFPATPSLRALRPRLSTPLKFPKLSGNLSQPAPVLFIHAQLSPHQDPQPHDPTYASPIPRRPECVRVFM